MRGFINDGALSPYRNDRNPLYGWDVNTDNGFTVGDPRIVYDGETTGLCVRDESWVRIDMPNLLPHSGGREQIVICRLRLRHRKSPLAQFVDEEKRRTGLYRSCIIYREDLPAQW